MKLSYNLKLSQSLKLTPLLQQSLKFLQASQTELDQLIEEYIKDNIFLEKEIEIRKHNNLPPFQRFISLILTGINESKLEKEALKFKIFIENKVNAKILGPVSAPIFRLKKKYRIRLLIRGQKTLKLQKSLAIIIANYKFPSGIKLSVDVDPISFN